MRQRDGAKDYVFQAAAEEAHSAINKKQNRHHVCCKIRRRD